MLPKGQIVRLVGPDVYFPIEIVTREYSGHLLLGTELAARGRCVVIGHKRIVKCTAHAADRPGVVFYKNSYMPQGDFERHELVGMDPEAGIVYRDFTEFRRTIVSRDSRNRAQFCFGPDDYGALTQKFPDLRSRIHLTGSPRVELWGPSGTNFYATAVKTISRRYGNFVLFASSGSFNHERYVGKRKAKSVWDSAGHAKHFSYMAQSALHIGLEVIVRPHPSDSWTAWQQVASENPRMHIETTYDLSAWARAARAVVHPGLSSAAFEAVCAGKPAISTRSQPETNAATDLSYSSRDAEHLAELLYAAQTGRLPAYSGPGARPLIERKLLHPLEGAAVRIANVLDVVLPIEGPSGLSDRRKSLPSRAKDLFRKRPPRRVLGDASPRPFKREPLHLDEVARDVAACLDVLGRNENVSVRELAENCFVLSRCGD